MNRKLPYRDMANEVANRGRYGDTTLMHVNPAEVQGLASLVPLTVNPDTGYPEAFLPFLAPLLGSALAPMLLGSTAMGTALGTAGLSALGSGLATTAVTGSIEEGMLAGLSGFAMGNILGDATKAVTGAEALADPSIIGAADLTALGVDKTADLTSLLGKIDPSQIQPTVTGASPDAIQHLGKQLGAADPTLGLSSTGVTADLMSDPNFWKSQNPVDASNFPLKIGSPTGAAQMGELSKIGGLDEQALFSHLQKGTPVKDVLGSKAGWGAIGKEAFKTKNLLPLAGGIGGIAVEEDYKNMIAQNLAGQQARDDKRKRLLAEYQEQIPGVSTLPTPGYAPGLNNAYAGTPSIGQGNIFGATGGSVNNIRRMRFKNGSDIPETFSYVDDAGATQTINTSDVIADPNIWQTNLPGVTAEEASNAAITAGIDTTFGSSGTDTITIKGPFGNDIIIPNPNTTVDGGTSNVDTVTTPPVTSMETTASPPIPSQWDLSAGYDPYAGQTGTRGRGIAPTPYNYMAGFMPEYQYVTNIQPTASSLGAVGTGTGTGTGTGGVTGTTTYAGPYGNFTVPTGSGNVSVYQDPDAYKGGTAYNEYLLGNFVEDDPSTPDIDEGKQIPSYLDAYTANQPYYQYQDQVLNDIWGGGGFGTPDFRGYDPYGSYQPQVNPLQTDVDTLNEKIAKLMEQIEGKDKTIEEQLAIDQASTFGQITPDSKSDLIVQEGEDKGQLNVESDIFDYLTPTQKAQYSEYDYLGKYLHDLSTYGEKTAADNFAAYVANVNKTQTDTGPGSLISADLGNIKNLDTLRAEQGGVDPNTGNKYVFQRLQDGRVTKAQLSAGGLYSVQSIYDVDADGNVIMGSETPFDQEQLMALSGGYAGGRVGYAGGGLTNIATLEDYMKPLPVGKYSLENTYQEGGEIASDPVEKLIQNPVIQEKMSEGDRELLRNAAYVILGRLEDDGSIIQKFVELFGDEAYQRLKSELMPQAEQNQGLIAGEGGGMDDRVNGTIGDQEQVALSPGEYIVPADVVADLGDGNNDQGAAIMDDFMERVRLSKHGTSEQPNPVNLDNVMPT